MNRSDAHIWLHAETTTLYHIPGDVLFLAGDYLLERFDGVSRSIDANGIREFEIDPEQAEKILRANYDDAIQTTRKHFSALAKFAWLTGKSDLNNRSDLFGQSGTTPEFSRGEEFIEDFFKNLNNTSASGEEQKEAFRNTFKKIPEIMAFFEEDTLNKTAEDPETWASEMYEKMFGETQAQKKVANRERVKNEIAEQIKKNIREAEEKHKNTHK